MLTRSERLRYRGLFLQAYQRGFRLSSSQLTIHYTITRPDCASRLPFVGFSVSKKFSKKAVIRNQIKRRLREIYRLYRLDPAHSLKLQQLGLLVIAVKNNFDASDAWSYASLQLNLEQLLDAMLAQLDTRLA